MNSFEKAGRRIAELTPTRGYNVVGVDTFEPLGEELYLVSHHATARAAERRVREMRERSAMDRFYVYGPPDAG